ncbi:MAG TPA: MFS transporter [Hyphomonadaceae bacterium]|jgi:MFS family permease|nr:MFS transporter [Hyphomonadaceae bacterium]
MFEFLRRSSPLWRHASFNRLWGAQALSAFGNRITRTAIPIIAVSVLAATPVEAAILAALSLAPMVLAGLFGGGFVERSNKLRLMVALDLARFAVVLVAPIAWYFGLLSFPLLCLIAFASGLASALFANADVSILPRLVGKEQVVEANSRLQSTESIAELTGPGVAGVLIDLLTAPVAIIADALTFLWSAFWLFRIPKEAGAATEEAKAEVQPNALIEKPVSQLTILRQDIVVGFRAIAKRPPLLATLLAMTIFYLTAGSFAALYTLFMMRELGLTPSVMGAIISVGGLSALLGTVVARPLAKRIGFGPAITAGFGIAVAGMAMLVPAAYTGGGWSIVFMIAQQLLGDAGFMIFMILSTSMSQKLLPENEIARANGFNQAMSGIMMTISILASGAIAEAIGVRTTVVGSAILGMLGLLPLFAPALLRMKEEPSGEAHEAGPGETPVEKALEAESLSRP